MERQHYRFDDVALVGFGLGRFSRLECCIALALGARVTVISHKAFRSHERTFDNVPFWSSHPSLVQLPSIRGEKAKNSSFETADKEEKDAMAKLCQKTGFPEPVMLRVFMLFKPYHRDDYSENGKLYNLTLLIHRVKTLRTLINPIENDLEDIDDEKKLSEQHRLLFFETLCDDAGISLSPQPDLNNDIQALEVDSENDRAHLKQYMKNTLNHIANKYSSFDDLDYYAFGEREHARWFIERWLQGTRYGDNKIERKVPVSQRRNPCMVAWYDLDDDTIVKDTEFLNRYFIAQALEKKQDIVNDIEICFQEQPKSKEAK